LPNPYKSEANHELMISKLASLMSRPAAATRSNCYSLSSVSGSKRKTPELLADPVGLFGRSRTLFKFLRASAVYLLNASNKSHCIRVRCVRQRFFLPMRPS
jgi:hypothetical protein